MDTVPNGQFVDRTVTPTLTSHGGYYSGLDGTLVSPNAPILPLEIRNVAVPNLALRGVGFRGGAYDDRNNGESTNTFVPSLSAPATESTASVRGTYRTPVFAPVRIATINYLDSLNSIDVNNPTRTQISLTPAQFKSASLDSTAGTLRRFTSVDLRLEFHSTTDTSSATLAARDT